VTEGVCINETVREALNTHVYYTETGNFMVS